MHTLMWKSLEGTGLERCVLAPDPQGFHLAGTVLVAAGVAREIRYSILTDRSWRTRVVGVHVQSGAGTRRLALESDGSGRWRAAGRPVPEAEGAVDVAFAFSPATHTLPIRRLDLDVGDEATAEVVFLDVERSDVEKRVRRYRRVTAETYRYDSGGFTCDVVVDDHGLVVSSGRFEAVPAPGTPA